MNNDTIVAIATPMGVGGIAVVRVSGPKALQIVMRYIGVDTLPSRQAVYCRFTQGKDFLDDGIAVYYPAPHSYTGEDVVEYSCHGSQYVQQAILNALIGSGARMATPGEFTLRAFRNGKLNLSQAEAVADLIDAVTPVQHRLAVSQLRGGYAQKLQELRKQLLDLTSLLELELDFSQEDVEFADRHNLRGLIATLRSQLDMLLDSFVAGNALKQGVPVAIVGAPNVGKSTLLNALLGDERAIVSAVPGTTRDTVDAMLNIEGITFRLIDTAGMHQTDDEVEQLGIMRSRKAYEEADIIVEVWDASAPADYMDGTYHKDGKRHIRVINKCDLKEAALDCDGQQVGDTHIVCTSAKNGEGIEQLKKSIAAIAPQLASEILLTNPRHREALSRVSEALKQADMGLASGTPADLVAVDLRDALYHLGTITGEVANDEVLSNIFSRFCVGK